MRKWLTVAVLCAVVCGVSLVSIGAEDEPAMPTDMAQYFVGFIYRGEKWTPEVNAETMEIQKAHRANIRKLIGTGQLVLAGPFGDDGKLRGLFFYDVKTVEEARKLADSDPAVQAGRLRVELHPWWGTTALRGLVKKP